MLQIYLPKFKLEQTFELSSALSSLGVTDVFDERDANLSRISHLVQSQNLYVSQVIHKAFVEVTDQVIASLLCFHCHI